MECIDAALFGCIALLMEDSDMNIDVPCAAVPILINHASSSAPASDKSAACFSACSC